MREHMGLFRGKRIDNGEWVEGAYCKHDTVKVCFTTDDPKTKHLIVVDGFCDWGLEPALVGHEVDPDTVGECTGLWDKNGKLIFEGDIIDCWSEGVNAQGTVQQNKGGLWIMYPAWQKRIMWGLCPDEFSNTNVEIIGNIHDNPELIVDAVLCRKTETGEIGWYDYVAEKFLPMPTPTPEISGVYLQWVENGAQYIDTGIDPASLRPKGEWISVEDRLPEEKEYVMIWCGECQIARIEKGISKEQREAMKRGELDDPCESGWTLSTGCFTLKRSQAYKACDEQGNNRVPYCWYPNGGPMSWFGQNVTHWMPLPKPPNSGADMRGNPNDS